MAGNLKLDSLRYGTLNNIAENGVHNSGDRRRTTTTTAINKALDKAYEKDTLLGVTEFNGIVVSYQEISYPTYRDRTSLLQEYIVANNSAEAEGVEEADSDDPQEYANIAYKVYIPEIEPRPAPTGNDDPVLLSYPDVFSDVATPSAIPLGTVVVVRYEDKETLFNPRIVSYSDKAIGIENISVDAAGQSLEIRFQEGRTSTNPASGRTWAGGEGTPGNPPHESKMCYDIDEESPVPQADRLRTAIRKLGYGEKGRELSNGGDLTQPLVDFMISFLKTVKEEMPGLEVRLTGGNDCFHQDRVRSGLSSRHGRGNAMDITIYPVTTDTLDKVVSILMRYSGANDGNARFIDEYRRPTGHATGGHFHISWGQGTEGRSTMERARQAVLDRRIEPLTVEKI